MEHEPLISSEKTSVDSMDLASTSPANIQEELRQILDTSATGITRCSRDLRYLSVNAAMGKLIGLPVEQIIGRPIVDVVGVKAFELVRPHVERVLCGERVEFEEEIPYVSGLSRFVHVVYTPWVERDGQIAGWVGSVSDVSDLKRATMALQDREQRLRLALDASGAGSWIRDARTGHIDWDDRFRKIYGFTADEPASLQAWLGRMHDEDRQQVVELIEQIRKTTTHDTFDSTFRIVRPDGTVSWIQSVGQAHRNAEGQLIWLTGLELDITERRRAEEVLQARRDEERDRALHKQAEEALRRSHAELELRTVQLRRLASQLTVAEQSARRQLARTLHDGLQQLLFSVGMTLDEAMKTNSQDDQIELLQRARTELKEAVEAARTLSVNLFPPVLHVGGLPAALSWLAKRTQEQYGIVVNVSADAQANPEASDVRILLFEAVRELLFNAVKHAGIDRVDVKLTIESGDTIHIQVSDDGVGFDPSATFHNMKQPQAGLGLFSIHERLALLGGLLDIQSAPGKGSRFTLTLPRSLPGLAANGTETQHRDSAWQHRLVYDSASGTAKSLRILIADDHAVARAGLRELFSKHPELQVMGEATSGVEAITQAVALQPDVVVMAVSLPQMNGIDATRAIHRTLRHIRIVGLSSHDDESTERLMRKAGAEAYFAKNEGTDRLVDYLLSLLTKVRSASAH